MDELKTRLEKLLADAEDCELISRLAEDVTKRAGLEQTGLRNLSALFLGFRIPKGTKTTNWAAARLSPQQINYAATDAWACRELYLRFLELGLV